MTGIGYTGSQCPSLLSMVNRVLRESGVQQLSTLVGATLPAKNVAVDALNDCMQEICNRARWEWQKCRTGIQLVAGQTEYPLPADFQRMSDDPLAAGIPLKPYTPEDYYVAIAGFMNSSGSPSMYTVSSNKISIWPVPESDYVTYSPILPYTYFRNPGPRISADDDVFNIPGDFYETLVSFGKWKVKAFLEYPDAEYEHQRYETCLQIQMNKIDGIRKLHRMHPQRRFPAIKSWT